MDDRLDALLPRETAWLDIAAVASTRDGEALRAELGAQLSRHLAAFVDGILTAQDRRAEAGVRVTF